MRERSFNNNYEKINLKSIKMILKKKIINCETRGYVSKLQQSGIHDL